MVGKVSRKANMGPSPSPIVGLGPSPCRKAAGCLRILARDSSGMPGSPAAAEKEKDRARG